MEWNRATILIAALSLISITLNCSFALENQRLDLWGMGVPPAKRAEFKKLQSSLYRFFNRIPAPANAKK